MTQYQENKYGIVFNRGKVIKPTVIKVDKMVFFFLGNHKGKKQHCELFTH